jgi:glycosyltransferase involved in cell wall biosynthesis
VKRAPVLLNALHTVTGGGLVYLQGVLPYLARDRRFEFTLLVSPAGRGKLTVPRGVKVWLAPEMGFWRKLVWEQACLPGLARRWGFAAVWCNANYGPLLAPGLVPTIHTTPRAACQAQSPGMRVYWWGVKALTRLSLWRAPAALSVAAHVIPDYLGPWMARKVRVAPPAVAAVKGLAKVKKLPGLVVAVGDYYPQKDYPMLVRAMALLRARLPLARLEIIGRPVEARVADEVRRLVQELKLEKAVREVGPLPHAALLRRLAAAQVLVSASRAECFNMPLLEALSVGTPVVAGDFAFQREVTGDAAVYVPLADGGEEALAAALHRVLAKPRLAAMLVKRGLARAALFGWERTAGVIAEVLARVAGTARRA